MVKKLLKQYEKVIVLDNFSSGRIENLENVKENKKLKIVKVDLRNKNDIDEYFKECDVVFHLAANPRVRILDPKTHYKNNFLTTYNVLEAMRKKRC